MAQKRMLSKRLTESDKIQALRGNDRARFMYAALLPHTDKAGIVNVNPMGLKGTILEGFEYTIEDIEEALRALASAGLIVLYRNGKHAMLAHYVKFTEFNKPHPNEAASDFPGPADSGSVVLAGGSSPSGSFPEEVAQGSSPTPTNTQSPTPLPADEIDSSEERMSRAFATGQPQATPQHRVRAELRRLAGPDFVQRHEPFMAAWSRWTNEQLRDLWEASDPSKWPGETHKKRAWILKDLLDEERRPPRGKAEHSEFRSFDDILAEAQRDLGVN